MKAADVAIVGGGVHGASVAYHLASDPDFSGRILLLEKDSSFRFAATALSAGSIRQQFSTAINIAISLYGIEFLREVSTILEVDGERPDIALREGGYLFLVTDAGVTTLKANHALQTSIGADIVHLDPDGLSERFPYLSTDGIVAGCWGRNGEGWFDGYALMQALRNKARALGVETMTGEAVSISRQCGRVTGLRLADGSTIGARTIVMAAGTGVNALGQTIGVTVPVEARKRMVFAFACRESLPRFPLLVDPTGVYVRPEGELYICGSAPAAEDDPAATDFEVDHAFFEATIWPVLAARVPAFETIKPGHAWAGHYDMNLFDHNAIVGPLADIPNLLVATGFSGHGLQQAPAVGRGLAELIIHGRYVTLDLSPLGYDRIAAGRPLVELNVV